ncbi:hypothetical protein DDB_G0274615 [Dictyostelium discoideum AX4]|uniref:Uncharacterized protein n=1 Tax=Dictyostelium discoideum TaxID=44689 RepID=Q554L9_DICDI|nr:hypothetical protein DDB_G0274615 [Dictyostelium discoideum AX4]EAL70200.1 hypothetical protein DDB_G0274615 [Dictyostelium discoideum AX4]|eukprot:XP_644304.1 hypothetical protein DDB_G0274615 [Dictyostelium discoideum AX4]
MNKHGLSFKEKVKEGHDRLSSRCWVIRFVLVVIFIIVLFTHGSKNKIKHPNVVKT